MHLHIPRSAAARLAACSLVAAMASMTSAQALDIEVFSAASMQSVLKDIGGDFERESGHKLVVRYATMGRSPTASWAARAPTLVIGSTQSITTLLKAGKIQNGTQRTLCKMGIGAVVPSGAPKPSIASSDDLKRAMLDAKVIVYANPAGGGAAGIHIAKVIEGLGIADQIKRKTKFGAGGDVTQVTLAQGQGALGMTQIPEIVGWPGADYVGPFPVDMQNYTGTVGIPGGVRESEAVKALVAFMQSPKAVAAIKARGMEVD